MDKYEYKVRADEIKELISRGEYVQAADIADTIDWRRVKSVMMLCTISDLYKINRRYEDARDMLLLAYERRPGGRTICYSLCELSIKMEDYVEAVEYYKEFVQVAPKDTGRYILQYKLYEAQDVSLEERIAVLEELKKRDYREKWAYELAYLYHRIGLAARCVEECDELILWFGEGKYVIKAMELKMLHEPLSAGQQEKYNNRFSTSPEEAEPEESRAEAASAPAEEKMAEITMENQPADTVIYEPVKAAEEPEEMEIHVKTMDVGEYNTINLQEELAAGLREVLGESSKPVIEDPITRSIVAPMLDHDTESLDYPEIDEVSEDDLEPAKEEIENTEVFFGETAEIGDLGLEETYAKALTASVAAQEEAPAAPAEEPAALAEEPAVPDDEPEKEWKTEEITEITSSLPADTAEVVVPDITAEIVMEQLRKEIKKDDGEKKEELLHAEPPKALAGVLSQESDGQLSLVMPEHENIEKQITGQMSIDDILAEWERMKKENQEKREQELRQHVLQQTGAMFTEFEEAVRDGLLEQLEREKIQDEDTDEVEELEEISELEETVAEDKPAEEMSVEESSVEEMPTEEGPVEENPVEEIPVEEADEEADEEATFDIEDEQEEPSQVAEEFIAEEASEDSATEESYDIDEVEEYDSASEEEVIREQAKPRTLSKEEKEVFAPYIQSKAAKEQLVNVLDNISLAAYTGNVIITGEEGMDTLTLAKNLIREIQVSDSNFSGKVAKISGNALNKKDVEETLDRLQNGALIISRASEINSNTALSLHKALQQESVGIVIILEDVKRAMDRFLTDNNILMNCFTARMDVEALSNDTLVAYGKKYAREREYAIDDFGMLALHTRIEELQTIDHAVTVLEVQEIVDEAIRHANRKTIGHFFAILMSKRYDEEDMIILGEKDFV